MSRVMLEFSEDGPDYTLDLDQYRQFIVPRVANIFKTYDNKGNEEIRKVYYPIGACGDEYFNSEYLRAY